MSSTNKTTNYELSQFIGSDKPAWLGDYNTDMSKIDAQMKLNADGVTSASGSATTANTSIGTLANLTTDAKTNLVAAINEVDANADIATTLATNANNNANTAVTTANGLAAYLNLTGSQNLTVTTNNGVISDTSIASAHNADGSLGKVYGYINLTYSGTPGATTITIADTSLRPAEKITIAAAAIQNTYTAQGFNFSSATAIEINTDGTVVIKVNPTSIVTRYQFILPPCLYFMSNFGD